MKRCDLLVDFGRRKFLSGAGLAAVGVAATTALPPAPAKAAAPPGALVDYPSAKLANVKDLKVNEPKDVSYPIVLKNPTGGRPEWFAGGGWRES